MAGISLSDSLGLLEKPVAVQELAENIVLVTPNEKNKRHGQAVAAASVPVLS